MEYIQISIDGLLYGSSYSLIALGFSLVFGVMRRINLAYGSSLLLGVAIALWVENKLNGIKIEEFVTRKSCKGHILTHLQSLSLY